MKNKLLLIGLCSILFFSCTEEDAGPIGSGGIFDDNGSALSKTGFDLLFTLELKRETDALYALTSQIVNLNVKIDGQSYGDYKSLTVDTSIIDHVVEEKLMLSKVPVDYGFLVTASTQPDTLKTIGEFADFMNNIFDLSPGSHFLEINGLSILDTQGNVQRIKTRHFQHFVVPENKDNFFLGKLTLNF